MVRNDEETESSEVRSRTSSAAPDFEAFVAVTEPRLRAALVALYGTEDGRDATAEALAYAWEHWARVATFANLPGYLFRVAQSKARRRRTPVVFVVPDHPAVEVEPGLPAALRSLSPQQRLCVVLVHAYGWSAAEAGALLGIRPTTVHNHLSRGLQRLRTSLGAVRHA
ncbi:MAG TPA: sigma-70 family RNA polymerase sigma factor [Acidimicrobiales bacterium]|nr:sigma-70 family RNA polymerase sigma factor [Acidimicrobiales bacterium]